MLIEINKTTGYAVYGPPVVEFIGFFIKMILTGHRERPELPVVVHLNWHLLLLMDLPNFRLRLSKVFKSLKRPRSFDDLEALLHNFRLVF